ncbi:MAG: hypothetical protein GY841_11575, partial [FCB group bacterium]|nr:hypothetical protein [FCB group bacterium]
MTFIMKTAILCVLCICPATITAEAVVNDNTRNDLEFLQDGIVKDIAPQNLPATISLSSRWLKVKFNTDNATWEVFDKRTNQTRRQKAPVQNVILTSVKKKNDQNLIFDWFQAGGQMRCGVEIELEKSRPEIIVRIQGAGELNQPIQYPQPFVSEAGTHLVIPMNEGISYPVDDKTIKPRRLITYGGHGICMAFWGATDGRDGYMAILETADDAAIDVRRFDGKLCVSPLWESQLGKFGYERRLRYVFFEKGGHVAICKRYRQYVAGAGRLKTLREKERENPNVDLLIGAVNIWNWDKNPVEIVKE